MPESSIADEITRLSGCRNDILSAISSKGVTVPADSVLSSCPALINSIQTGGGGGVTALYNTGVSATATASATATYTATQRPISAYDTSYVPGDGFRTAINYNLLVNGVAYDWSSVSGAETVELHLEFNDTAWSPVSALCYTGDSSTDPQAAWPNNLFWSGQRFRSTSLNLPMTTILGTSRSYSSEWSTNTKINMSFASYDYATTGIPATGRAAIIDLTGTSYPYPDRPDTEYITASGSVSSYEYVNTANGIIYTSTGSVSSQSDYGTVTQPVSGSGYGTYPGACAAKAASKLTDALDSDSMRQYFPTTAYYWSRPNLYTVSSGVSGLY